MLAVLPVARRSLIAFVGNQKKPVRAGHLRYSGTRRHKERKGVHVTPIRFVQRGPGLVGGGKMGLCFLAAHSDRTVCHTCLMPRRLKRKTLTAPPAQSIGDVRPDFSPDGQNGGFFAGYTGNNRHLLTDLSGETRRLTFDNLKVIGSAWMPDGKSLVFSSNAAAAVLCGASRRRISAPERDDLISKRHLTRPSLERQSPDITQIQNDSKVWGVRGVKGATNEVQYNWLLHHAANAIRGIRRTDSVIALVSDTLQQF